METPNVANDLFKEGQEIIKEVVWAIALLSRRNSTTRFYKDNHFHYGFTAVLFFLKNG